MKNLKELIIEKLHINKDTGKDEIIDEVNDIIYKIQKSDNDVSMVFKLCEYINESSKILKYLNDLNYEISIEPRFKGWGTYKEAGYVITIYDKNLSRLMGIQIKDRP